MTIRRLSYFLPALTTMKKNIVISLIAIICCVAASYAQNDSTYTAEMLEGKDWFLLMPTEYPFKRTPQGIRYEATTQISFIYDGTKRMEASVPYYLSTTPDKTFNPSKTGKSTSGKYIIIKYPDGVLCTEILKLTGTELIILNHRNKWQVKFSTTKPQ